MPHSTTSGSYSRESSVSRSNSKSLSGLGDGDGETNSGLEKFPDLIDPPSMRNLAGRPFSPGGLNGYGVGLNSGARLNGDRWMPAAARNVRWGPLAPSTPLPLGAAIVNRRASVKPFGLSEIGGEVSARMLTR